MPNYHFSPITDYMATLFGKRVDASADIGAYIYCYEGDIQNPVVRCVFYEDGANIPENRHYPGSYTDLNYPMSKYDTVLDLLRNEEPVYYAFIESTKIGYLSTRQLEPVGEEES